MRHFRRVFHAKFRFGGLSKIAPQHLQISMPDQLLQAEDIHTWAEHVECEGAAESVDRGGSDSIRCQAICFFA